LKDSEEYGTIIAEYVEEDNFDALCYTTDENGDYVEAEIAAICTAWPDACGADIPSV